MVPSVRVVVLSSSGMAMSCNLVATGGSKLVMSDNRVVVSDNDVARSCRVQTSGKGVVVNGIGVAPSVNRVARW